MQQTKVFTIVPIAAGASATVSLQFDAPFPNTQYATGVSLSSNSLTVEQTAIGVKGLRIVSMTKRVDGIDLTLHNPDTTAWPGDTVTVWAAQ